MRSSLALPARTRISRRANSMSLTRSCKASCNQRLLSVKQSGDQRLGSGHVVQQLARFALGKIVEATCDGCAEPIRARINFIAREAEYTPPVIYSREERAKLVFMIEARPEKPDGLRPGLPITVAVPAQ